MIIKLNYKKNKNEDENCSEKSLSSDQLGIISQTLFFYLEENLNI